MKLLRASVASTLLWLSACDRLPVTGAPPAVEYRPELAGTVDHALCLLGFSATPLKRLLTGHQVVEGLLNGRPATFVLDTGANVSVVHAGFASEFGLTPQRGAFGAAIGLGGGLRADRAAIDALKIGAVDIRLRHVMTADLAQLESVLGRLSGGTIHGIIGQDVMTEHRAVIDVSSPILYLQDRDVDPAPIPASRCQAPAAAASDARP